MWGAVSSLLRWGGTASCPASCLVHLLKCFPAFHTQGGFFPTAPGAAGCSCPASMFPPRHVEAHLTAGGSYPLRSGHSKAAPELNCQLCLPTSLPHHCLLTCQPVGLSMPLLFPAIAAHCPLLGVPSNPWDFTGNALWLCCSLPLPTLLRGSLAQTWVPTGH